eukprot:s1816_g8.t1
MVKVDLGYFQVTYLLEGAVGARHPQKLQASGWSVRSVRTVDPLKVLTKETYGCPAMPAEIWNSQLTAESQTVRGGGKEKKEKAHLRRITEGAPRNAGVVVLNEADVPIGFGVTARSTEECTSLGAEALVVYHQADVGEYLREEADLV